MTLLLSEALLLLLLEEEKGASVGSGYAHDAGLAGALLLDLAEAGLLEERDGALVAVGAEPSAPALAAAWRVIAGAERPRDAKHWVSELGKRLKPLKGTVAEALVAAGVLDERRHKLLGLFPSTRYPELDPGPERALRSHLRDVLVTGVEPDPRVAALLGLLVPMDLVKPLLSREQDLDREERKAALARAKAIADRGPVGDAVKAAVQQQVTAVVIASTVAATTAATAGSN